MKNIGVFYVHVIRKFMNRQVAEETWQQSCIDY